MLFKLNFWTIWMCDFHIPQKLNFDVFTIKFLMFVVMAPPSITSLGTSLGTILPTIGSWPVRRLWLTHNPECGFQIVLKFLFVLASIESRGDCFLAQQSKSIQQIIFYQQLDESECNDYS